MFRRILVPLDGSALAEAVLPQAMELARLHGAEVVLLRVESAPDYAVAQAAEEAQHYLGDVAASLREARVRVSTMVVLSGDTAGEILVQAELTAADLILMSTHGRSGVGRWMLGSVAEKVLRAAVTPVLLVRVPSPRRSASRRD
ncbi:MAG TPA: universal stress protein [Candidatus Sulfotelmatobacter sp.]|nr:universal stress protein [Candidatus Sulfotelmatobacter sp.]